MSWVDDLMGGPDPAAVPTAATMQPGVADLDAAQPEPEPEAEQYDDSAGLPPIRGCSPAPGSLTRRRPCISTPQQP